MTLPVRVGRIHRIVDPERVEARDLEVGDYLPFARRAVTAITASADGSRLRVIVQRSDGDQGVRIWPPSTPVIRSRSPE